MMIAVTMSYTRVESTLLNCQHATVMVALLLPIMVLRRCKCVQFWWQKWQRADKCELLWKGWILVRRKGKRQAEWSLRWSAGCAHSSHQLLKSFQLVTDHHQHSLRWSLRLSLIWSHRLSLKLSNGWSIAHIPLSCSNAFNWPLKIIDTGDALTSN